MYNVISTSQTVFCDFAQTHRLNNKIMLYNPSPRCCLLWRSRPAWRAGRSWLSSRHSSSVSVHSGPGALDGSTQMSPVSAENPPHTPVMLKEVLHYLDVQPGQVRNRICCSVKEDYCFCMKYSLFFKKKGRSLITVPLI